MANLDKKPVAIEELLISSLAQTDALAKLLIKKGVITQEEFLQKIAEERATYQALLNPSTLRHDGNKATRCPHAALSQQKQSSGFRGLTSPLQIRSTRRVLRESAGLSVPAPGTKLNRFRPTSTSWLRRATRKKLQRQLRTFP
jgi:hypothetical protein